MEKEKKHIDDLIVNYLAEGLDEASLKELKEWLALSPENMNYFRKKEEIWFSAINENEAHLYNTQKAFESFKERVEQEKTNNSKSLNVNYLKIAMRYASVALLFLMISLFAYWKGGESLKNDFKTVMVEAPLGSQTKLYLPDGTLVWLNAGSSIEYSQAFGIKNRKLTLNGEAYFEVTRNEKKMFEVTANNLTVKVLGTKFNFRNYIDEEGACITLLEGKVSVKNEENGEELMLNPNQQAAFNKQPLTSEIIDVKAVQASEWTKGIIFFDEEKLPDIARELERLYNVQIVIKNESLMQYRFYGNFYRTDQTIQEVIDALSSTNKLRYTIEGKTITLY